MRLTQYLIFEISAQCNLAGAHLRYCPAGRPDRYGDLDRSRPLTDEAIVETAAAAHHLGFAGLIGWHYYCEPMLAWPRIRRMIAAIREETPVEGFVLWTNGYRLADLSPDELRLFRQIVVTNYDGADWDWLADRAGRAVEVRILAPRFDGRAASPAGAPGPCYRPYNELVLDHYGNGHLCCWDYCGAISLGSLWDSRGFAGIVREFCRLRNVLIRSPLDAPEFCQRCAGKMPGVGKLFQPVVHAIEAERMNRRPA